MADGIPSGSVRHPYHRASVVAARALAPLKNATVAWGVANMDYSPELSSFGSQVNVPIPAEFATNLIADGGTITRHSQEGQGSTFDVRLPLAIESDGERAAHGDTPQA